MGAVANMKFLQKQLIMSKIVAAEKSGRN